MAQAVEPSKRTVPPTVFTSDQGWVRMDAKQKNSTDSIKSRNIRILTYNIWFADHRTEKRMNSILEIIEKEKIDILCCQEVTKTLLQYILSDNTPLKDWYLSGIEEIDIGRYGNVIFSRWPIDKVYFLPFHSQMGRQLVATQIIINGESFVIGNLHLESMSPHLNYRIEQLQKTFAYLHKTIKCDHNLIMGDFNQCGTLPLLTKINPKTEKKQPSYISTQKPTTKAIQTGLLIPNDYSDAWVQHCVATKTTVDETPGYTMAENRWYPAWRPDHIIYRFNNHSTKLHQSRLSMDAPSASAMNDGTRSDEKTDESSGEKMGYIWALNDIKRVGMEAIELDENEKTESEKMEANGEMYILTPSDHFGLVAEFVMKAVPFDTLNIADEKSNCQLM